MRLLILYAFLVAAIHAEESPLKTLADEMKEAEEMLKDARHDIFLRTKLDNIDRRLGEMIDSAEKTQKEDKQKRQNEQKNQAHQEKQREYGPASPLADSQHKNEMPKPNNDSARITDSQSQWAKLPPAIRDEMLQTYGSEMPERWRKRLQAYFLSIAAEESKDRT